jgi:colanic acid/amylovoran biosynthesis glycosyltransferase
MLSNKLIVLLIFFLPITHTSHIPNKRPLKILFVVGNFPAPSQVFILNMITGFIDRGHDVSIFAYNKFELVEDIHPNIDKYHLMERVTYEHFPKRSNDYDIVFCQFGYLGARVWNLRYLHTWLKMRKLVVCFRGADISKHLRIYGRLYKPMFKFVDLVLPVCHYFKPKLIKLGCDKNKIKVHHSAIDCSLFDFSIKKMTENEPIHLISVSRLVKKKGIDYAIRAMAIVAQKHPNIHFTIVGSGPEKEHLMSLVEIHQLQDKVTFYGWATQEEVISLLQQSHIFLLPSRTAPNGDEEGIANALKESMAMGLISVGTWHAGTPELIEDHISGFLVPERDTQKLASAIEYIIEHPNEWESIALTARKKIEDEFETKKSVEKLEKIFYKLCSRKNKKTSYR